MVIELNADQSFPETDIIIHKKLKNNEYQMQSLSHMDPRIDPFVYPLFFPLGILIAIILKLL